jgi:hypothetical protein
MTLELVSVVPLTNPYFVHGVLAGHTSYYIPDHPVEAHCAVRQTSNCYPCHGQPPRHDIRVCIVHCISAARIKSARGQLEFS